METQTIRFPRPYKGSCKEIPPEIDPEKVSVAAGSDKVPAVEIQLKVPEILERLLQKGNPPQGPKILRSLCGGNPHNVSKILESLLLGKPPSKVPDILKNALWWKHPHCLSGHTVNETHQLWSWLGLCYLSWNNLHTS